jgi:hypothetical protein
MKFHFHEIAEEELSSAIEYYEPAQETRILEKQKLNQL